MTRYRLALTVLLLSTLAALAAAAPSSAAEHRWGIGLRYWQTFDGLPSNSELDNIDDNGESYILSYQYVPGGFFRFELDLEVFESGFAGTDETAWAPQAFILVGGSFYGGVGAGVTYSSGLDDDYDPFYAVRLGWELQLLGALRIDLNATYRFDDWDQLEDFDVNTDTYTLGAIFRFQL